MATRLPLGVVLRNGEPAMLELLICKRSWNSKTEYGFSKVEMMATPQKKKKKKNLKIFPICEPLLPSWSAGTMGTIR
jgi:hypothetical protein